MNTVTQEIKAETPEKGLQIFRESMASYTSRLKPNRMASFFISVDLDGCPETTQGGCVLIKEDADELKVLQALSHSILNLMDHSHLFEVAVLEAVDAYIEQIKTGERRME